MEKRLESRNKTFLEKLEHGLNLLDPNKGSFFRIYVKGELDGEIKKILKDNEFTIVYALTPSRLKSEEVQEIILNSQYISYQDKSATGGLKPFLPFRVALITTKAALEEAMKDNIFAGTWRGELQYGWSMDE